MVDPVVIRAEPASLQVRTAAMSSASAADHVLVVGQDESGAEVLFHGGCSCGHWSASSHPAQETIVAAHASHAAARKEATSG